ncbi:galactocerebrosidase-like [Branchiostoma floridae]|uniref:Galactocerebrosidase n=1 Tax=Branchiostoma floridae TaxID=7739 RepID=C3YSL8_BRAFL|nr:galactocerebrosidase-like [Branchiostoma floridae]|eukprot:XP_002600707.1 hypothetical protein BRAFLDRAFT_59268 [Branchiostoma floridae]
MASNTKYGSVVCLLVLGVLTTPIASVYTLTDQGGLGARFDGVGGLSGGGATSRLLVSYPEPYRSQILDYLFKPNFGAALQILKVEIGGDAQSTDGSEPSHMHSADDQNYTRGYEWWLMREAKKRNPSIKLYGLPWAFPGWVGGGEAFPYHRPETTANYIVNWILGAKTIHGLTIDYVGIWNERIHDVTYIKTLRKTLDDNDLGHVMIVAPDGGWVQISKDIMADPELAAAVDIIGSHYPGTHSAPMAQQTGKTLWSSEDYSTYNNGTGASCWARILNQNYVNGHMTSTISWNLIASYYDDLPFPRAGLMTANQPWSGHYEVSDPIWVTAHTTHFTSPGWQYLKGVGHLDGGGSYVSLTDGKGGLTIVIEAMTHQYSQCVRPLLPPYDVKSGQVATFQLGGAFENITRLHRWDSKFIGSLAEHFQKQDDLLVSGGKFSIAVAENCLYTLTTVKEDAPKLYPNPPKSAPFPLPYKAKFDGPADSSEAPYFADQTGVFELYVNESSSDHVGTLRQNLTERPIVWCNDADSAISVIGDYNWSNVSVSCDVMVESGGGAFVAARVDRGGCDVRQARGVFFWLLEDDTYNWIVSSDLSRNHILGQGKVNATIVGQWHKLTLYAKGDSVAGFLNDGKVLFDITDAQLPTKNGFAAIGTLGFQKVQFDNFAVDKSK